MSSQESTQESARENSREKSEDKFFLGPPAIPRSSPATCTCAGTSLGKPTGTGPAGTPARCRIRFPPDQPPVKREYPRWWSPRIRRIAYDLKHKNTESRHPHTAASAPFQPVYLRICGSSIVLDPLLRQLIVLTANTGRHRPRPGPHTPSSRHPPRDAPVSGPGPDLRRGNHTCRVTLDRDRQVG